MQLTVSTRVTEIKEEESLIRFMTGQTMLAILTTILGRVNHTHSSSLEFSKIVTQNCSG